jgi:hypothetical protein
VVDRDLRDRAGKPGLCSEYAISGNKGLKHMDHATDEEWSEYYGRYSSAFITGLRGLRRKRDRRRRRQVTHQEHAFEAVTGQGVLLS